ncbi:DUF572-domain-containing protein [Ascodesmis nigricans]|uniref:DUF572-domain-containing protein n=1 Tax=Ascodesmis nigricans TaxID=341454 RepID=A0A4V3SI04_9PEZI|nr:DUF572-domain-containing protein [Ascodesmis nigricans]
MPFNIFCLTCEGHIAQGVRFNAEKKKVGHYYSTPIFAFRMKHTVCQGWIEVQTDPQNTAYVVTEGGKKKAADVEPQLGVIKIHDPSERTPEDPFARREKEVESKTEIKRGAARIDELRKLSDRNWADPYEHSRKMRRVFRAERKELKAKAAANEAIRDRAGLAIELLDESPEDAQRAKLVEFGPSLDDDTLVKEAQARPLFAKHDYGKNELRITPNTRKREAPGLIKEALGRDLRKNTRAAVDPFLTPQDWSRPRSLKRKSCETEEPERKAQVAPQELHELIPKSGPGLVDYDSDE